MIITLESFALEKASAAVSPERLRTRPKVGMVDDLEITYQPILNLATGLIEKCEALCRPPEAGNDLAAFVDAAERDGTIKAFNARVIDGVFADWHKANVPGVGLSVNLRVANLAEVDLVKHVEKALKKNRLAPGTVWFEFDDRAQSLNDLGMIATLGALRKLGIRLSIDSFGDDFTQTTLYEIERLDIGELKVDGRYVRDADENMRHRGVITATVELAKHLRIGVSAKGIESESIAALMRRLGCTHGQGYYFARPMGGRVLATLVEKMARAGPMPSGR